MTTIATVRFRSIYDRRPRDWVSGWDTLCASLSKHERRDRKEDGDLWSPVVYRDGKTRANKNVEAITCAVIDVDNGTPLSTAVANLDDNKIAWFAYSTFSNTPEDERYHIVIPLDVPHSAGGWHDSYTGLRVWLGVGDSTCDAARMFYRPQAPVGGMVWHQRRRGYGLLIVDD